MATRTLPVPDSAPLAESAERDRAGAAPPERGGDCVALFEDVTKYYGSSRGVIDVDLELRRGEVLGLLGPNGAGKTTLLRTMLDLIRPTAGRITVMGRDAHRESVAVRRELSYLPGELALPPRLTGRQAVRLYTSARGPVDPSRVQRFADRLDLDLDRRVGDLSKGNKQKVGVVLAFAPDVPLLVLDEPTSGLDPLLQRTFRDFVFEAVDEGRTVLLSSHVMEEVEHLATRVALMREGRVVAVDSVDALKGLVAREVRVRVGVGVDVPALTATLTALPGVTGVTAREGVLELRAQGSMDALVKALAAVEVDAVTSVEPDLEDVFVTFYETGDGIPADEGTVA
ncbi:MAG: ABC transporter ATP-binding protein [Candidatus Nanopelagicales bacterium]